MDILFSHKTALHLLRDTEVAAFSCAANKGFLTAPSQASDAYTVRDLKRYSSAVRRAGDPVELLTSDPNGTRSGCGFVSHVWKGELPPGSVIDLGQGLFCSSAELVALQLGPGLTELELTVLLCEMMGTYSLDLGATGKLSQRPDPLTDPGRLETFISLCDRRRGLSALRRAAKLAIPGSASPMETKLVLRLCMPAAKRGYGLKLLSMNEPLEVERIGERLDVKRVRRPDILIAPWPGSGAAPVAIEYDGEDFHMTREGVLRDTLRGNELKAMGIGEYRINCELYRSIDYMEDLVSKVREDAGYPRQHRSKSDRRAQRADHLELYRELAGINGII